MYIFIFIFHVIIPFLSISHKNGGKNAAKVLLIALLRIFSGGRDHVLRF